MSNIKDLIKWSVIMCVAAALLYFVFPKYKFMGPNGCALYKCNTITGHVLAYDFKNQTWVTPNTETTRLIFALSGD